MHTSTNTSARRGLVLSLAASVGCARVDATVQVVNGPTAGSTVSQDVPAPSAGGTYAGGAPDFAPQGTTPLTLLY